jgi:predicted RNase H-like HicB family nuclease
MHVRNYIAIAEPSEDGKTWWISFPGFPGVTSVADRPEQIAAQARDALASAIEAGAALPPAIEDGVIPSMTSASIRNRWSCLCPIRRLRPRLPDSRLQG